MGVLIVGSALGYYVAVYGANHGCFSFVDYVLGEKGYLSCGPFGFLIGAVMGAILGVLLVRFIWRKAD